MEKVREQYQAPDIAQVNLVPEEAALEVCKNHLIYENIAENMYYCSWPHLVGGGNCQGVTGS